jgi:hypothetical protein
MQMRLVAHRGEEAREELNQARCWILFVFAFEFDVCYFRSIDLNFLPVSFIIFSELFFQTAKNVNTEKVKRVRSLRRATSARVACVFILVFSR